MALEEIHRHAASGMEKQALLTGAADGSCQRTEGIILHREDIDIGIAEDGISGGGKGATDLLGEHLGMGLSTTKNLNNLLTSIF